MNNDTDDMSEYAKLIFFMMGTLCEMKEQKLIEFNCVELTNDGWRDFYNLRNSGYHRSFEEIKPIMKYIMSDGLNVTEKRGTENKKKFVLVV